MFNFLWKIVAQVVSTPAVVNWLIKRAKRTPYSHIMSADGQDTYMERYWLFNPYPAKSMGKRPRWQFPISIRLHYIRRPDGDRDLHDHPWNARTIILRGAYSEERLDKAGRRQYFLRAPGDTVAIAFEQYHRISQIYPDGRELGTWTMFITGKYRGKWGFKVGDAKVPYDVYLNERGQAHPDEGAKNGS